MSSMGNHALPFEERQAWVEKTRANATGIINRGVVTTAPWLDPEERVAWLTWCQRSWSVDTPVSGDDLARATLKAEIDAYPTALRPAGSPLPGWVLPKVQPLHYGLPLSEL